MITNVSNLDKFTKNAHDLAKLVQDLLGMAYDRGLSKVAPGVVQVGVLLITNMDNVNLIDNFAKHSHPYWEMIKKKEEDYFDKHLQTVFGQMPLDIVASVRDLYFAMDGDKRLLNDDDRNDLWDFFQSLVKICIKYIHEQRKINLRFHEEIDIKKYAEMFEITLPS